MSRLMTNHTGTSVVLINEVQRLKKNHSSGGTYIWFAKVDNLHKLMCLGIIKSIRLLVAGTNFRNPNSNFEFTSWT